MNNSSVYNRLKYKRQISQYIDNELDELLVPELLLKIEQDKVLQQYLESLQAISSCFFNNGLLQSAKNKALSSSLNSNSDVVFSRPLEDATKSA